MFLNRIKNLLTASFGMTPGMKYTFMVRAYNSTSWHNSNAVSITMPTSDRQFW